MYRKCIHAVDMVREIAPWQTSCPSPMFAYNAGIEIIQFQTHFPGFMTTSQHKNLMLAMSVVIQCYDVVMTAKNNDTAP